MDSRKVIPPVLRFRRKRAANNVAPPLAVELSPPPKKIAVAPVILNEVKNLAPPLVSVFLWQKILHFVQNDRGA